MARENTTSEDHASGSRLSSGELKIIANELQSLSSKLQASSEPIRLDSQTVIEQMKDNLLLSDQIDETIKRHFNDRVVSANEAMIHAKSAFSDFSPSLISPEVIHSATSTFVNARDDPRATQAKIFKRDLEALSEVKTKKGMKLILSKDEISSLKLDLDTDTLLKPRNVQELLSKLKLEKLTASTFQFNPLAYCIASIEAEEIIQKITNQDAASPTIPSPLKEDKESNLNPEYDTDQFIKEEVGLQMQYVTPPEAKVLFGITPRATQEDLQKTTDSFELRGGPADVTAYHDFYSLQISLSHVWTELFDQELAELGKKLYSELVKLKKELGENIDQNVVTSLEELQQLKKDLIQTRLTIAENDGCLNIVRKMLPEVTMENWVRLDDVTKESLLGYTTVYNMYINFQYILPFNYTNNYTIAEAENIRSLAKKEYLEQVNALGPNSKKKSRVEHYLEDLEERLKEKYAFHIFAPNSVNFGLLVTYRQEWKPLKYQVGELVSTIPLAPKESRKYSTRKIIKKTRTEKEIEDALRIFKEDSSYTSRDHAEILLKAENKTAFKQNAEGGVNFALWNAKGSHSIDIDSAQVSSQVKKEFRESVLKAAQEYKNEHRLEIDTSITEETEITATGEVTNPNDELPVTFLFYELERCYEISEKIHKLTPVILVANDVPYPHEIDESWLLTHDWILRRVILDDSYKRALDYLVDGFTGDEISIEILRNNWAMHLDIVEKMARNVLTNEKALDAANKTLYASTEKYSSSLVEESEGFFEKIGEFFTGESTPEDTEMLRVRMEAAKEAFQRAERNLLELRAQLGREVTALEEASDKYTRASQEHFNRRTEILRLRAHVKDNILYYMQCIWDQEPHDQRFFRLYDQINVPVFDFEDFQYKFSPFGYSYIITPEGKKTITIQIIAPRQIDIKYKKLVEVADLENPLGYKGNYIIFPLKENNALTTFMMQDYIEMQEVVHLRDPDELGEYNVENLRELLKCLLKLNPNLVDDKLIGKIKDALIKRLSDPHPEKEIVIVPTTSLFIEALPGKHPILEDFKLVHRAVDVKKVQSEVRHSELENIRLSARNLKGDYEDPDIDKKIVIEGKVNDIDVSTD